VIQHVASREKLKFQLPADGAVEDLIEFIRVHSADTEITLPFTLSMGEAPATGPASTPPVGSVTREKERKGSGETNE
jgi:hypothetical protein